MKNILTILFLSTCFCLSCEKDTTNTSQLELLNSYSIDVPEPSGLAISGNVLYTVSDNTNNVYKLSTAGLVLQTIEFNGNDLEGVSNFTNGKLLLVEERTKQIIELTITTGDFLSYQMNYDNDEPNAGIEGVAYNSNQQIIYFLNEKDPGKLFKLNNSFNVTQSFDLNFANDYSGIHYDSSTNLLWIVSDESQTINKCTPEGELLESYSINVNKSEGIVVTNDKIYVVSDSQERLYVFQKPN